MRAGGAEPEAGARAGACTGGTRERGAALSLLAIATALLLLAFGAAYLEAARDLVRQARAAELQARARAAAEGGLAVALERYLPAPARGRLEIGGAAVEVTSERLPDGTARVRSVARLEEGAERVRAEVRGLALPPGEGAPARLLRLLAPEE
ncbi:MAG: hypothetical protein KatS3mg102_2104 [Planctomycetota bacterium]|nr:MAG: hypothetical protein KatS3mg102_2104 [Planctomycetota bacterium]